MEEKLVEFEARLVNLEAAIEKINARNQRVEADKAWEVSIFRKVVIAIITYIAASIVLNLIGSHKYLLDALIPSEAYLLSVQTIPMVKRWWIERRLPRP